MERSRFRSGTSQSLSPLIASKDCCEDEQGKEVPCKPPTLLGGGVGSKCNNRNNVKCF